MHHTKARVRPSQTAQHSIAHARFRWAFARGYYTPRNVAVGDHTNRFQVLEAFDYSNFAAVVPRHHFGCLPHGVLRRAASKISDHNVFAFHKNGEMLLSALI